jgi:hypothetical protein
MRSVLHNVCSTSHSFLRMKYEISQARTIEAVLPYANVIRSLKPNINQVNIVLFELDVC